MKAAAETRLWLLQRGTALVMAPLVLVHLAVILYAVRHGLSAGEILARTRGSLFWGGFYGLFVLAAAVHVSIGLRAILHEATALSRAASGRLALAFAAVVLLLGLRAVYAVVIG